MVIFVGKIPWFRHQSSGVAKLFAMPSGTGREQFKIAAYVLLLAHQKFNVAS